jgi:hypothetical protein
MKLILREYLASLKERGELDAILPDLLSELGYNVYSRPARGTTQHGVDVAAVGEDEDGQQKVFLFSVKQGDLTRQDWDGTPQGLRSSLNEIQDVYIPTKIASEHHHLKVVICLCFGGDVQEQVRSMLTGYIRQHTSDVVSFREWNGDKLAELLLSGVLREDILPKALRANFQKAVAMIDEPDVSYRHFRELSRQLVKVAKAGDKQRVTSARQLYVCLWVLFVWARDIENLEAPYRLSELTLLTVWDLLRPFIGKQTGDARAINSVLHQLIQLHFIISSELLEKKVLPHVGKRDAVSLMVPTRTSADVNLKLFELLGRIAMTGIWLVWFANRSEEELTPAMREALAEWALSAFKLIENNRCLFLPLCDHLAIEVCLVLLLTAYTQTGRQDALNWLSEMASMIDISVRTHGKYPCVFTDYGDLIAHPREQSESYREEATSGSILIPLIAAWLTAWKSQSALSLLKELKQDALAHCTFQLWLPDSSSEDSLYAGGRDHGTALCDVPVEDIGENLLDVVAEACENEKSFVDLSAVSTGYWPIVLLACKHFRLPIPPQFWIDVLRPTKDSGGLP